jgi:hypothetical protein
VDSPAQKQYIFTWNKLKLTTISQIDMQNMLANVPKDFEV